VHRLSPWPSQPPVPHPAKSPGRKFPECGSGAGKRTVGSRLCTESAFDKLNRSDTATCLQLVVTTLELAS